MLRFGRNSSLYALVCEQLYQDQHGCVALSPFAMNPFKEKRLHQRMLAVAELVQENKQSAIYRPEADGYSSLVQTMTSFKELLADSQKIDLLLNPLCTALSEGVVADDVEHVQNALQAAQTWQQSVQQFCSTMQHSYAQYADVAEPCVAAANEVCHFHPTVIVVILCCCIIPMLYYLIQFWILRIWRWELEITTTCINKDQK